LRVVVKQPEFGLLGSIMIEADVRLKRSKNERNLANLSYILKLIGSL
jgi:hypothetical protein